MTIKTVYIRATSKKELNERLVLNANEVYGDEYSLYAQLHTTLLHYSTGTVIKIYSSCTPDGTPIAKTYGIWDAEKRRVK